MVQLSTVSEGTQIFEFLLELSLKKYKSNYRYIWHIYRLNLLGEMKRLTNTPFNESYASFSPNGNLISFISDESGINNTMGYALIVRGNKTR